MHCLGPGDKNSPTQAIERHIAEAPLADLNEAQCAAIALSGSRIELARTPPSAVAGVEFDTLHGPFGECHERSPLEMSFSALRSPRVTRSGARGASPAAQSRCCRGRYTRSRSWQALCRPTPPAGRLHQKVSRARGVAGHKPSRARVARYLFPATCRAR